MATVARSQIIMPGDTARLRVRFNGPDGNPADTDVVPSITIVGPGGGVAVGPTSAGVFREAVGVYGFDFDLGLMPEIGVWRDIWQGVMSGFAVFSEFTFQVNTTQLPAINSDGYKHLGDDPGFNYSQNAICNINNLLKTLRARLKSSGKHKTTDEFGNVIFVDCDIYSTDLLVTFLANALTEFNEIPHFTFFSMEDTNIIEQFHAVLVQGATLMALSSQALIERGREFQITDNGIGFSPPTISEMLSTQWNTELSNWWDKLTLIKKNMKPAPIALGTLSVTAGASPQVRRLRFLRSRQIF